MRCFWRGREEKILRTGGAESEKDNGELLWPMSPQHENTLNVACAAGAGDKSDETGPVGGAIGPMQE